MGASAVGRAAYEAIPQRFIRITFGRTILRHRTAVNALVFDGFVGHVLYRHGHPNRAAPNTLYNVVGIMNRVRTRKPTHRRVLCDQPLHFDGL